MQKTISMLDAHSNPMTIWWYALNTGSPHSQQVCECLWQQHSWSHNSITHNFGFIFFTQFVVFCGVFSLLFLSFSFGWNNNNTNLAKFLHLIQYNDINAHTHTLAEIVYILATCCCRYVRFFSLVFFHCLYVSSSLDTHNSYRSIFDKLSWVSS